MAIKNSERKKIPILKIIDSAFFAIIFVVACLALIFSTLKKLDSSSVAFKTTIILSFVWIVTHIAFEMVTWFLSRKQKCSVKPKNMPLLFVAAVTSLSATIAAVISFKFHIPSLSSLNNLFLFCLILFLFYLMVDAEIHPYVYESVFAFTIVSCFLMLIIFKSGVSATWINHNQWEDLTLNFHNPNPTAEYTSALAILSFCAIFKSKFMIIKVLSIPSLLIAMIMTNFTSSRSPLIALVCALSLVGIYAVLSRKKANKTTLAIASSAPAIYAALLIILFYLSFKYDIGYQITKKLSFNTRYFIWAEFIQNTIDAKVFTSYSLLCADGLIANTYNSHLGTLLLFGPVTFVLFIFYLYRVLVQQTTNNNFGSFETLIVLFSEFFILFLGFNECGMFTGNGGVYILGIFVFALFKNQSALNK